MKESAVAPEADRDKSHILRHTGGTSGTKRRMVGLGVLVVFFLLGVGCSGSQESVDSSDGTAMRANRDLVVSDETPTLGGRLVYGLSAETNGWNPSSNQWAPSGLQVSHALFDTLSAFDSEANIHPYLAESFAHNDDFTQWRIRVRPNIKLHNGRTVTAETIVRNQMHMKNSPVTGGAYRIFKGFSTEGDQTVVVDMDRPYASFPMFLSTQLGVVADADWMESNDSLKPVGTGPFALEQWTIGDKLVVKKNHDYWRKDPAGVPYPYLDAVEFKIVPDTESRSNALRAGDIDIMQSFSGQQVESFQADSNYQLLTTPRGETSEVFVQLNTQAAPFDDPKARLALAHATNKEQANELMAFGYNEVANGPFSPGSPWFTAAPYPQYDEAKAIDLVNEVKQAHGSFSFKLSGGPDPQAQRLQQFLQQQWTAVGIDVQIDTMEQSTLIIKVVNGTYQATTWEQFDAPHPTLEGAWWDPNLAVAPPAFSLNFARIKDEQIGEALTVAGGSADPVVVKQAMGTIQQRLATTVPYVWLYHKRVAIIGSKRVVNMTRYTLPDGALGLDLVQGSHPLFQVWLRN